MTIDVVEESPAILQQYEAISIAFRVETRLNVVPIDLGLGGLAFRGETVVPYIKDYDLFESERPSVWPARFDLSNWGIFSAFHGDRRVGGAAVAWQSPQVEMLEGRDDLACLWDLRVAPEFRNQGVGHRLFTQAVEWARQRNCRQLKVETQNINVPACRFYARQGCKLGAVNNYAYRAELDEVQLLWYLDL